MRRLILVVCFLVAIPATVFANGSEKKVRTDADRNAEMKYLQTIADQSAEIAKLKKTPCGQTKAVEVAGKVSKKKRQVKNDPHLSSAEKEDVINIYNNLNAQALKCDCEGMQKQLTVLQNFYTALADRVAKLEDRADNTDVEQVQQNSRLAKLEGRPLPATMSSSYNETLERSAGSTRFQLRLWSETLFTVKRSGDFNHLAYQTFGVSLILRQKMSKKFTITESGEIKSTGVKGYVLVGLNGGIGLSIQDKSSTAYSSGAFVAYQWRNGLYLGGAGTFLVEGMNPSQHWFIIPAGLFGVTVPGPESKSPIAWFIQTEVGVSARLSGEAGWRPNWSVVFPVMITTGIQFF
jgi:hypothetical protein